VALFDEIKAKLDTQKAPAATPNYQAMAAKLLAAKSGKAAPASTTAPAASQLGQTAAVAAASEGIGSKVQGLLASQGLEAKAQAQRAEAAQAQATLNAQRQQSYADLAAGQQKGALQRSSQEDLAGASLISQRNIQNAQTSAAYQQGLAKLASDRKVAQDDLFSSYRQGTRQLAQRQDAADLEQLATTMALSDEAYINQILQVGELNGLRDSANFQREYARLQNNNDEELAQFSAEWFQKYSSDKNQFDVDLANMNGDVAMQVMAQVARAEGQSQMIQGGTKVGTAAYGSYKESQRERRDEQDRQNRIDRVGY